MYHTWNVSGVTIFCFIIAVILFILSTLVKALFYSVDFNIVYRTVYLGQVNWFYFIIMVIAVYHGQNNWGIILIFLKPKHPWNQYCNISICSVKMISCSGVLLASSLAIPIYPCYPFSSPFIPCHLVLFPAFPYHPYPPHLISYHHFSFPSALCYSLLSWLSPSITDIHCHPLFQLSSWGMYRNNIKCKLFLWKLFLISTEIALSVFFL